MVERDLVLVKVVFLVYGGQTESPEQSWTCYYWSADTSM